MRVLGVARPSPYEFLRAHMEPVLDVADAALSGLRDADAELVAHVLELLTSLKDADAAGKAGAEALSTPSAAHRALLMSRGRPRRRWARPAAWRARPPRSARTRSASTASGSNWVPAWRESSSRAAFEVERLAVAALWSSRRTRRTPRRCGWPAGSGRGRGRADSPCRPGARGGGAVRATPRPGCGRPSRRPTRGAVGPGCARPRWGSGLARMCGRIRSLPTSWSSAPAPTSTISVARSPRRSPPPSRWPQPRANDGRCRRPPRLAPSPVRESRLRIARAQLSALVVGQGLSGEHAELTEQLHFSRFELSLLVPAADAECTALLKPGEEGAAATAPSPAAWTRRPIASGSVPAPATTMKPPGSRGARTTTHACSNPSTAHAWVARRSSTTLE